MDTEIYLDNNATTHLSAEVRAVLHKAVEERMGNASSEHRSGELARRAIAKARASIANLVNATAESVIFGSGVSELNNWVISESVARNSIEHLIVSEIEHSSIAQAAEAAESRGIRVSRVPVGRDGRVDLEFLRFALQLPASLVSVQWVNNETGTIQPVEEISKLCIDAEVPFHCDAAQAVGKLEVDLSNCAIDYVTISAHKMHGPAGVGALVVRDRNRLAPMIFGGNQEFGLRPGTENVLGIVGFGCAAESRIQQLKSTLAYITSLRDQFERKVKRLLPFVRFNGSAGNRVCNTTNITFPGVDGAAIVALLDRLGIRCSQTSACLNNRPEPSFVLIAMGLTEEDAYSSVRFSFSDQNTMDEVDLVVEALVSVVERLKFNARPEARSVNNGVVSHEV
jgi:cysteine desulfurase